MQNHSGNVTKQLNSLYNNFHSTNFFSAVTCALISQLRKASYLHHLVVSLSLSSVISLLFAIMCQSTLNTLNDDVILNMKNNNIPLEFYNSFFPRFPKLTFPILFTAAYFAMPSHESWRLHTKHSRKKSLNVGGWSTQLLNAFD